MNKLTVPKTYQQKENKQETQTKPIFKNVKILVPTKMKNPKFPRIILELFLYAMPTQCQLLKNEYLEDICREKQRHSDSEELLLNRLLLNIKHVQNN